MYTSLGNIRSFWHLLQTCIAVIYCVITVILFIDNILPFLIGGAVDGLLLIAVIVVAVTVGKPLSYLNCQAIGSGDDAGNAYYFTMSLGSSLNQVGGQIDYNSWIGTTKATCFEMKSIWGLSIALWLVALLWSSRAPSHEMF